MLALAAKTDPFGQSPRSVDKVVLWFVSPEKFPYVNPPRTRPEIEYFGCR